MVPVVTRSIVWATACVLAVTGLALSAQAQLEEILENIKLPPGFEISVFADKAPNARQMAVSPNGTVFVGSRSGGMVYAVVDSDGDHRADKVHVLIERGAALPDGTEIRMPSGLAFKDGALYIGAVSHILRLDDIENRLENPPEPVIVTDSYPAASHHGWKFIAFGPDNKLYVPVGAPCNDCEPPEPIFATITRMNADGSGLEIIAKGVRNTVGFDWHPVTKELWFTDNGRDLMGDAGPTDELNRISQNGSHFGFPYCHQGDTLDPKHGKGHDCADFVKPAINLGPHVAAIGMRFYRGDMFPAEYKNQIFIAEHGSWNSRKKTGYRITVVKLEGNEAVSYEPFAEGWVRDERVFGRPADVVELQDGSLLVSDDMKSAIYRITYRR